MTLWFGLALMTAAAIWAVLWPLARRASQLRSGSDVAIYRDQLEEIERDRAAGLIEDNEAASAQVEVSRRLIAAADAQTASPTNVPSATWRRRAVAILALVLLPFGATTLYLAPFRFCPQINLHCHALRTAIRRPIGAIAALPFFIRVRVRWRMVSCLCGAFLLRPPEGLREILNEREGFPKKFWEGGPRAMIPKI